MTARSGHGQAGKRGLALRRRKARPGKGGTVRGAARSGMAVVGGRDMVPVPVPVPVAPPPETLRARHDGFTPERRRLFLETLAERGIVTAAAQRAGISRTTARRWRDKVPGFAREWDLALAKAGTWIDLIAFERATIGGERVVMRDGKVVLTERKPSDSILRVMMMNAAEAKVRAAQSQEEQAAQMERVTEKLNKWKETMMRHAEERAARKWGRAPSELRDDEHDDDY